MLAKLSERLDDPLTRRRFLNGIILGLGGLAGAVVTVPIVGYLLSPILKPVPEVWRDLGSVDQFTIGETVLVSFEEPSPLPWAGQTAKTAAWLRRNDLSQFTAYDVNCTHLGCPVRWLQDAELFLCPCHGGVYDFDGNVAGGPPPKPLFRYDVRIRDGRVELKPHGVEVG